MNERISRRELLLGGIAGLGASRAESFAIPGPFPAKVVEVLSPGVVDSGKVNPALLRAMMARGMCGLTGAADESGAWKRFFSPADRVGIKVCCVGRPASISQPETILEVVRGLQLAGVPMKNMVVFNRYADEFQGCGFEKALPEELRTAFASPAYSDTQVELEGYDPGVFVEFPRVMTGMDPSNAVHRRSHLCDIVSRQVDKVVNVCAMKDHASAGITMALKNLSHGLVNNVCRTHINAEINWCDTFIPAIVAMQAIRRKVVLHICDALIATYDGGPGAWNPHFRTWEYSGLLFATDPVAMDRVGWNTIDRKRALHNLPPLAETGKAARNPGHEAFNRRQPEHVLLAARKGLGTAELKRIRHHVIRLDRPSGRKTHGSLRAFV